MKKKNLVFIVLLIIAAVITFGIIIEIIPIIKESKNIIFNDMQDKSYDIVEDNIKAWRNSDTENVNNESIY